MLSARLCESAQRATHGSDLPRSDAGEGINIPIYLSSHIRPVIRENQRVNATTIEAYAADPVRKQLHDVENSAISRGYRKQMTTMLSYGGLATIRHPRLHETLISGPIGGMLGAHYVSKLIGAPNVLAVDMGGTSYDFGLITHGTFNLNNEPEIARFRLALPSIELDSIRGGAGLYLSVDPVTNRIIMGPEGAGANPGPVCFDRGNKQPTITDCLAINGYLNKDKLWLQTALDATQRAIQVRGGDVADYVIMGYGGAGPLVLAGVSEGQPFKGVLTFPFAAAFSAFGCTTTDYSHRYTRSSLFSLQHNSDTAAKETVIYLMTDTDIKDRIANQQELPTGEGEDPLNPELTRLVNGKVQISHGNMTANKPLKDGDILLMQYRGMGGFGDPLDRDPALIDKDLENGIVSRTMAEKICGAVIERDEQESSWVVNREKTNQRRAELRQARLKNAVPVAAWKAQQKARIEKYDLPDVALEIFKDVSSHSRKWIREYRELWGFDESFTFNIPSIRDVNPFAMRSGESRVADDPLEF